MTHFSKFSFKFRTRPERELGAEFPGADLRSRCSFMWLGLGTTVGIAIVLTYRILYDSCLNWFTKARARDALVHDCYIRVPSEQKDFCVFDPT